MSTFIGIAIVCGVSVAAAFVSGASLTIEGIGEHGVRARSVHLGFVHVDDHIQDIISLDVTGQQCVCGIRELLDTTLQVAWWFVAKGYVSAVLSSRS